MVSVDGFKVFSIFRVFFRYCFRVYSSLVVIFRVGFFWGDLIS